MYSKTYLEICSQYMALDQTCSYIKSNESAIKEFYDTYAAKRLLIIGCGSSFSVGKSIQLTAGIFLGIEANCLAAGDLMLHAAEYAPLFDSAIIIVLSRSGSTHEVLYALSEVKKHRDCKVISIVCSSNTALAEKSDFTLELPWAFDESVCQTRSVTNLYAAAQLLLSIWSGRPDIEQELRLVANEGDNFFARIEKPLKEIAEEDWDNAFVLADGVMCGLAEEAALALTEISFITSKYSHVLDVRHGPMLLIGPKTLVIACITKEEYSYHEALMKDLISRGARIILLSDFPKVNITGVRLELVFGQAVSPAALGMPMLLITQLLAYYRAVHDGLNPDQPAGLDAWISLDCQE